jgi:hypothetical protein
MTPIPPAAVLFLLQSGYSPSGHADRVDSINGVANESRRAGMSRPGNPEFIASLSFFTSCSLPMPSKSGSSARKTIPKPPS